LSRVDAPRSKRCTQRNRTRACNACEELKATKKFVGRKRWQTDSEDRWLCAGAGPRPDREGPPGLARRVITWPTPLQQTVAPLIGAALLAVGSANNQNYDLLLYTAGVAGLVGACSFA